MGIDPQLFGPYMWGTMHYVALGAPAKFDEKDKATYKAFFSQIPGIIPCSSCGQHLTTTMNSVSIDDALSGNEELFAWTVELHNAVNKRLGKSTMSVSDARDIWMNHKSINDSNWKNNWTGGAGGSTIRNVALTVVILSVLMGTALYVTKSSSKRPATRS
jgi:hypothetical protein